VYFKCDKYVTIEMMVRPKSNENYIDSNIHRNDRLLVICYRNDWKELKYVKSREIANEN